jgi:hypothetical protein
MNMTTQTQTEPKTVATEVQDIHQIIDTLSDDAKDKLVYYVDFLRYEDWIEEQEDAEDIAAIEAITQEERDNAVPMSEIIKDYEAKYGPLN